MAKKNRDIIFIFLGGFKRVNDPIALSLGLKVDQVFGNEFSYANDGSIIGLNFQIHWHNPTVSSY